MSKRTTIRLSIAVFFLVPLGVPCRVSSQEPTWGNYKEHALKGWSTYRRQFDSVRVSGRDDAQSFELNWSQTSQTAVLLVSYRGDGSYFTTVDDAECVVAEQNRGESQFQLTDRYRKQDVEQSETRQIRSIIDQYLFPMLYIEELPIDQIFDGSGALVKRVSVESEQPDIVILHFEIEENCLRRRKENNQHPMAQVAVVVNPEKLWVITSYTIDYSDGRGIHVAHDTVGFLGCAVSTKTRQISSLGETATLVSETTRTYTIVSPEHVQSRAIELRSLMKDEPSGQSQKR